MIFKQLKSLTVRLVAGANVATTLLLWLVGYSDCIDPAAHPTLSALGLFFPIFLLLNLGFLVFWVLFRWRMVAIPIVGYAVAYFPLRTYIPLNMRQEPPEGAIKVLSYNVQGFAGSVEGGIDAAKAIRDYVRASKADIVCVQEAATVGHPGHKMLDSLYAHSQHFLVGANQQNAVAIYTRYPIVRSERIDYPSAGNGSVATFLRIGRDTVVVVNNHFESTHLSLDVRERYKEMLKGEMARDTARAESRRLLERLSASTQLRAPQADSVHAYVCRLLGRYPVILCGDFNDSPISYTHRTVADGLTDCYVSAGRGLGVSFNQEGFYVRIDNMMCSEEFQPYSCRIDDGPEYSDHYPIVCWLARRAKP